MLLMYQKLKKLYSLSDERKWGNIASRTEFFYKSRGDDALHICRFGIKRYLDEYYKITCVSSDEIYKIKHFQKLFKSGEEIRKTDAKIIVEITIEYLDRLLLEIIRNECKDLLGTKVILHSFYNPEEVREDHIQKRIYIL